MKPIALSIVIPVYNGARTIAALAAEIEKLPMEEPFELILVNDGSRDDSAAVCREIVARARIPVTFLNLARNFGEHNAVLTGYRHARGAYIVNIDDDFQNPPSEIARLFQYAREGGYDVVYTRFPRKEHSPWRNWGSRFTHRMANLVLDKPPDLYLSSFRCITALVAREIGRYDGAFPYIDGLILQTTQNIGQLEVAHDKRQEGQSGYTLSKLVHLWSSMLVNFSIRPLQVATVIGVLLAALGFAGAAWMVVAYFFQDYPPGWGTLICSLLIFSGTQLIMLGVVGEYLGRLYLNMNRKPQAVIRDLSTNVKPD